MNIMITLWFADWCFTKLVLMMSVPVIFMYTLTEFHKLAT